MEKHFLALLLATIMVPSVASASWWNPFSWSIFQRTDTQTQVLEKRIRELENRLGTATSSKESKLEKPSVSKDLEQVVPVASSPAAVKTKTKTVKAPATTNNTQIQTKRDLEAEYKEIVANYAKLKEDALLVKDSGVAIDILKKISADNEDLFRISTSPKTAKDVDFYEQRYSQMRANFNREFSPATIKSILEDRAVAKQTSPVNSKQSSSECISANDSLKDIQQQIIAIRSAISQEKERLSKVPGMTQAGLQGLYGNLDNSNTYQLTDLTIKESQMTTNMMSACGLNSGLVSPINTGLPINTSCYFSGYTVHCSTY